AIADQLNVFPTDHVFAVGAEQFRVARRDVDDLRRVEADRFRDDRTPSFAKRASDDVKICSRRTGADYEWIRQLQSVDCGSECWHNGLLCKAGPFSKKSDL